MNILCGINLYYNCSINMMYSEVIMPHDIITIKRRGDDGYKVISVRIKEGTLDKIEELVKQSNRSRNEIINILLENSVDNVEIN